MAQLRANQECVLGVRVSVVEFGIGFRGLVTVSLSLGFRMVTSPSVFAVIVLYFSV